MVKIIHWTSPKNAKSIILDQQIESRGTLVQEGKSVSSSYRYSDECDDKVYFTTCTDLNCTQIGFVFNSDKIKAIKCTPEEEISNYYVIKQVNLDLLEEVIYFELSPDEELDSALELAKKVFCLVRKIFSQYPNLLS